MTSLKDTADTVQAFATAGGIVVGGIFTYYKFVKDRIYRPRVNIGIEGGVVTLGGVCFLLCRFTVTNNGTTKLPLKHAGTVGVIRRGVAGNDTFLPTQWSVPKNSAVIEVFADHDWIESTETIRDELLVRLESTANGAYRVELRLVVGAPSPIDRGNIVVSGAEVILATQSWKQT